MVEKLDIIRTDEMASAGGKGASTCLAMAKSHRLSRTGILIKPQMQHQAQLDCQRQQGSMVTRVDQSGGQ